MDVAWGIVAWPRLFSSDKGTQFVFGFLTFPVTGLIATIPFLLATVLLAMCGELDPKKTSEDDLTTEE